MYFDIHNSLLILSIIECITETKLEIIRYCIIIIIELFLSSKLTLLIRFQAVQRFEKWTS